MSEAWVMAENERRMMSMVRMGTVTALDAPNGRIRADVGGVGTDWLPWITGRAGSTKHWSAPSIGEQVLVLAPFGDTLQAVVLAGVFSDGNPQPSASADVEKTVYRDGTSVTYDAASHALTIDCVGTVTINCTNATVKAQAVTIDAPSTTCTGDLLIKGKTTAQGLLTYLSHP